MRGIFFFSTFASCESSKRVSYGHEIAARAATPEWRAMDELYIVVREAPGSNPWGSIFGHLSFREGKLGARAGELGIKKSVYKLNH